MPSRVPSLQILHDLSRSQLPSCYARGWRIDRNMAKKHQTEYELNRRKLAKRYLKQERERKAEFDRRTEKPSARPAARLEFQRMNADYFLYLKKAFAAGHDMAFLDAVLNCMQPGIPMPDWVRD